uniref:HOOK_N domain-containing protein n=1 Tax=Globodera pallida TaxID=36090 RepID=A0A183C7I7_GLOPA
MAPNESPEGEDNANAFGRLADALREGGDTAQSLSEAIENGDPEQLQHWYELISEVPFEGLQERLGHYEFVELLRAVHLLMQWEHAQAEELKEAVDREAAESAEREENWKAEREALKAELNALKDRNISAGVGIDVNESFRAEIDALSAENAELKQLGRERDRQMAEMGDRTAKLEERLQGAEREKALLTGNQAQLEDNIRELTRRLNTQSETNQQGAEWEARKLRQRNEQALVLSEQVRELAAQNDELRAEGSRLSGALEEATELLKQNTARFVEFNEQFEEAQKQLEQLRADTFQLRELLAEKEKALKERSVSVELSGKEFGDVMQAKDVLLEKQRVQMQRIEAELDECRFHLETAIKPDHQKEEELERLRLELMKATETARKLFGVALMEEGEKGAGGQANGGTEDGTVGELRLRLIQMDQQLEERDRCLEEKDRSEQKMEQALEQKDLQIARLLNECQRYRKMAFGDSEGEMMRIEKQLEYRNKQIEQLNRRCSELQIELEQYIGDEEQTEKLRKGETEEVDEGERKPKRRRVIIKEEEEEQEKESEEEEEVEEVEEKEENGEEEYKEETIEEEEEREEKSETSEKEEKEEKPKKKREKKSEKEKKEEMMGKKRKSRELLLREATDVQSLHGEITRLIREMEGVEAEMDGLRKQYTERGTLLMRAKETEAKAWREVDRLKELLLFNDGDEGKDPLERLELALPAEEEQESDRVELFTELRRRERMEALELENAELRRFVENVAEGAADERERRMAEGTRRLVFLAVREAKLERRLQISQRLRMAMCQEMGAMKGRLHRVMTGEESRSRQLLLENEAKLFELARLQNALLHSVPVNEYNRLLREHKRLLRDKFLSPSSDLGYHSETEEQPGDNFVHKLYGEQYLDINRTILCLFTGQNDTLNKETEKLKAELDELNAFLNDIEAETELKSMLANIERRFLQALREQFESGEERETLQRELRRSERNFSEARELWLNERRRLVDTVGHLHAALQRLHRDQLLTVPGSVHVTTAQLEALAAHLRRAHLKEKELREREREVEERAKEKQRDESALRAQRTALEAIMDRDYELRAVHAALQGYVLNELTLSAQLQQTRKKLEKADKELGERMEELDELRETLATFQYVQAIDLQQLERQIEERGRGEGMPKWTGEKGAVNGSKRTEEGGGTKEDGDQQQQQHHQQHQTADDGRGETKWDGIGDGQRRRRGGDRMVLMVDNSAEWAEQLKQVREQAKLCVDTYKEQLESREKTLDDYRQLVEQLRAELSDVHKRTEAEERKSVEEQKEVGTIKSAAMEELEAREAEERWERRTRALERALRTLEEENMELDRERASLDEMLRAFREEKEEERRRQQLRRHVKVQVNIKTTAPSVGKKGGNSAKGGERKSIGAQSAEERSTEQKEDDEEVEEVKEEEEEDEEEEESGSSATDGGGSDSGTVEDFEQKRQNGRDGSAKSSSVGTMGGSASRRSKASTRTIAQRPSAAVAGGETADAQSIETMVLRHRNETRRLRMRVMELERRNKELSEQYTSLRERSRLAMRTRPPPSAGDRDNVSDALRRENERLHRQNANLNKSLEAQREEAERIAIRLRRTETQGRVHAEAWEERKRLERTVAMLRKRLGEGAEREQMLQERLERRERHIEQLGREQNVRLADGERVQTAIAQWRAKATELEQRERTLGQEKVLLAERCNELTRRLETMAREHAKTQKRLAELIKAQQKEQQLQQQQQHEDEEVLRKKSPPQKPNRKEAQTQTPPAKVPDAAPASVVNAGKRINVERIRSAPPSGKTGQLGEACKLRETNLGELRDLKEVRAENQSLLKRLRRAELLQREADERLESVEEAKERLLTDYNALLRLEKRRALREEEESVGMALLRDKLEAKEREVATQRHRIIDLEGKVWHMEMAMEEKRQRNVKIVTK